jgi:hypothetical protein
VVHSETLQDQTPDGLDLARHHLAEAIRHLDAIGLEVPSAHVQMAIELCEMESAAKQPD